MKLTPYLISASALLMLASCSSDGNKLEQTFGTPTLNLVADNSGAQAQSRITPATYTFHINYTDALMEITVPSITLGNRTISFTTGELTYKFNSNLSYTVNATTIPVTGEHTPISNFTCRLTDITVAPPANVTGDIQFMAYNAAIISYSWGDYSVRTFPADAVYMGSTTTTVNDTDQFTTQTPTYRLSINPETMTADLIIYNGKFSDNPKMPSLNLILRGLTVTPGTTGYSITGTDVVPQTLGEGTPYPSFTFATVDFNTLAADLTSASLKFTINSPFGLLGGSFSGSYLIDTSKLQ